LKCTLRWNGKAKHPNIIFSDDYFTAEKSSPDSQIGITQANTSVESGIVVAKILIKNGGDSCVLGYAERKFEVNAENPEGNMQNCVGNSNEFRCWGVTGWGTFWKCGNFYSHGDTSYSTNDIMILVLDFDKEELRYYKNNKFHGKFIGVKGKLYLTASVRDKNKITLVPCLPAIVLPQLIEAEGIIE